MRAVKAEQVTGEMFQPSAEELEYTNIIDRKRFGDGRRAAQGSGGVVNLKDRRILIAAGVLIALAVCVGFAYLLAS